MSAAAPREPVCVGQSLSARARRAIASRVLRLADAMIASAEVNEQRASAWDGYRVDARIVVYQADDAVLVPAGALFRDGAGFAVIVAEAGTARKRLVDVPRRNYRMGFAARGLPAGKRVIAFPGDTVRDGVRIEARMP